MAALIRKHAPGQIRHDKEIMVRACEANGQVLDLISADLQEDREIIEAAVDDPCALYHFPRNAQRLYPELVAKAILSAGEIRVVNETDATYVAEELWANLQVAEAWFEAGGHVHEGFPESLKDNEQFGLLAATYQEPTLGPSFIDATSTALRSNKAFMMQALEVNGMVYDGVEGALERDFDLAIVAFSGTHARSVVDCMLHYDDEGDDAVFMRSVLRRAREKVEAHSGFTQGFLPGIAAGIGSNGNLRLLDCGEESTLALKKKILGYLGAPTGKELQKLRKAIKNLAVFFT